MAKPVISYDKDLPEIPDRQAHLPPNSYLRKKPGTADEFEIVEDRRPSKLLLVNRLRQAVDDWRAAGYPDAFPVAERLFTYWFEEDHLVNGKAFRYYFGQREAVETLLYLVEVRKIRDAKVLVDTFGEIFYPEGTQQRLAGTGIVHQTTMDGTRQIRRYIPEVDGETIQDLPPENLRRYAFKMATGSGKTVVMAMLMVWFYFHRRMVKGSDLSTNFLLLAPNVIVFQRLEKDFASNRIFHELPLIPPEWRGQWNLKVILRGESTEPDPSGNLFLTNIHQIYESREGEWTPANAVEALLGQKPVKDLASRERSMLDRIKSLRDLVVINDEAHHVHDEELQWHKTLMAIHQALPAGLSLYDIVIPLTRPVYAHNYRRLSELNPLALDPVYDQEDLDEPLRIRLKMEFATTETEVHQVDIAAGPSPLAQDLLASITNKVMAFARLPGGFADLYPLVRDYVLQRCFGRVIDLEKEEIRSYLRFPPIQEGIAKYLGRKIGELTAEKRTIEFENVGFKLSETTSFTWRRNLPLLTCKKTIFNLVATYNDYEKAFARFLDRCPDTLRFAALGTTEQESGTRFRVDYLKPSGAIGFYYPDWVAVQQTDQGEVNWIIETKGRVWEDTLAKDAAIADWCKKVSDLTGIPWRFVRVNQAQFGDGQFPSFLDLLAAIEGARRLPI